ncbi:MAG: UvrD-helicase domain-containing protein [bacterium]
MSILKSLNPMQKEAAKVLSGPLLIIAGAGSGKTRVLTHRIANLIKEHNIKPSQILAVTFTNKAADEMKTRLKYLVGPFVRDMWVGTFHGICGRILRVDIDRLGRKKNFVIFDATDQLTLMRHIVRDLEVDEDHYKPRAILAAISRAKNDMLSPDLYAKVAGDFFQEKVALAYERYQRELAKNNALDFDDMLMLAVQLFAKVPQVLEKYQDRFKYINVDEYQDTNKAQYSLTKMLAKKYRNICVVGDEDQSIYSFRGADFTNILNFEKDYPEAKVIKLEQNYRSTAIILDAANHVIRNNSMRKEKALWTAQGEGHTITHLVSVDGKDEARYIAREIEEKIGGETKDDGRRTFRDFVILYRTNAQSRVLEEAFMERGIPYRIYSGVRFYERAEIKDVMAFMRIIFNVTDDQSTIRLLKNHIAGIGKVTLQRLEERSSLKKVPFFETLKEMEFPSIKVKSKVQGFINLIENLRIKADSISVTELLEKVLEDSGYLFSLQKEGTEEALTRIENIKELASVTKEFEKNSEDKSLGAFLTQVSLVTDLDQRDEESDAVALMTLHGVKGLEFPYVFIVGMEEGIFPHFRSLYEPMELEEERRLCYVGITRAKEKLYLTTSERRMLFGEEWGRTPSRFFEEIPEHLIDHVHSPNMATFWKESQAVSHRDWDYDSLSH